ncbi:hypothetical protein AAFF_G00385080 [Aldrovandia affinis]|uniref:DUF4200 domain-containing protein n=1 Tax=Aldrovandia affinis TaxID=143900 RepID=A0AAD7WLH4_9TELE|nr:hypothetical protein AAFF_G00385080 [Aldrovandia affinis]
MESDSEWQFPLHLIEKRKDMEDADNELRMQEESDLEQQYFPLQLIQKRKDMEDADNELRMQEKSKAALQSVEERKAHLQRTVYRMEQCKEDFHDYLKIKDTHQETAVRKAKHDRQVIDQRQEHQHVLQEEITALTQERKEVEMAVQKYSVYGHYMDKVAQASKTDTQTMVSRFKTLVAARESMRLSTQQGQDSMQIARRNLASFSKESANSIMQLNSTVAQHQRQLDEAQQNCIQWETTWTRIQKTAEDKVILSGQIRMACLNLYRTVCGKSLHCQQCPVDPEDTDGQLKMIKTFITQWTSVLKKT